MREFKYLFLLFVFIICASCNASAQMQISADEFFEYDKGSFLNWTVEPMSENPMYKRYRIEYDSVNNQRVPGWLTVPAKGEGPFSVVIVGHGAGGSKSDFDLLYGYLASRGFASLAIDAQYHGDREVAGKQLFSSRWYEMRSVLTQTVVDLRRSIDFIETQGNLDMDRIGYVGISMGVLIGTPFISIDKRVKTAVLVVGGGDFAAIMDDSQILPFVLLRNTSGIPVHEVADKFAPVDPVNYIERFAPRPLLMLNGKYDNVIPNSATNALFNAAGEPKKIVWYESGHIPPFDKVMDMATKWLNRYLKNIEVPHDDKAAPRESTLVDKKVSLKAWIESEDTSTGRLVTISATPEPSDLSGLVLEAVFKEIDFSFELRDDGFRGDEVALDGIYSIKLPMEEILKGVIPDSIYDCHVQVRTPMGHIIQEVFAGNAMQRKE